MRKTMNARRRVPTHQLETVLARYADRVSSSFEFDEKLRHMAEGLARKLYRDMDPDAENTKKKQFIGQPADIVKTAGKRAYEVNIQAECGGDRIKLTQNCLASFLIWSRSQG